MVLTANLHLWIKASEHDKHALPGKQLHLQEQFVHLIMKKTKVLVFFFLWKQNIFLELLRCTDIFAHLIFNFPSLKLKLQ